MEKRYAASLLAAFTVIVAVFSFARLRGAETTAIEQREQDRAAYAAYLAQHPFTQHKNLTEEELRKIPKADRPDLAAEQDFLRTMDPATKEVPKERLWAANTIADQLRFGGAALAAVTNGWTERGPDNVGGRTRGMMWDPNTTNKFWAGGVSGGLWTTTDITNGTTPWTNVDDFWANLAVTTLAYDPTNTMTFYAGTGEGFFNVDAVQGPGIWKSTDGGATWAQLASTTTATFNHIQDIVVHPTTGDVYVATRLDGVQRSQDGGTTWTQVLGFPHGTPTERVADLEISANNTLYAALGIFSSGAIYSSTTGNAGAWTRLDVGGSGLPTSKRRIELATAPSDANRIYAAIQNTGVAILGLYRSDNGGTTWSAITTPVDLETCTIPPSDFTRGQAWYDLIMAVDPLDEDVAIVGGIDLFRTTDAGANWTQISVWTNGCPGPSSTLPVVHADQHQVLYKPGSSTEIVFGHDGGIDYTATGTSKANVVPTYINRNDNYNVTQFYSAALHPGTASNIMLAGSQDNGTQRFTAAGLGSTTQASGGDGGFTFIDQDTPTQAIASFTGNSWRRSFNTGVSFSTFFNESTGSFINPADYDDAANILFATRNVNEILRLSDVFGTPAAAVITTTLLGGGQASAITVSPYAAPSSTLFVGGDTGRIVKITNAETGSPTSVNLDPSSTLPLGYISCIEVGVNEDQLLVTYTNYGVNSVWETTDGGTTWVSREGNLPDMPVRWAMYNPGDYNHVILATEAGIWETDNVTAAAAAGAAGKTAAVTWTPVASVPNVRVDMLQRRTELDLSITIMAATHGRGVLTGQFNTLLPVELIAFDALADGRAVVLTWETASETNNAGFEVQRAPSIPNPQSTIQHVEWEVLDFVEGYGTTEAPQTYQYRAEGVAPGAHRFRLKQIDYDGTFEYSPEVEVLVEMPEQFIVEAAYPNPFNPAAQFRFAVQREQAVRVDLFDMQGRRVQQLYDGTPTAGQMHTVRIDGGGLSSGTYLVRVQGAAFTETQQVVLVK